MPAWWSLEGIRFRHNGIYQNVHGIYLYLWDPESTYMNIHQHNITEPSSYVCGSEGYVDLLTSIDLHWLTGLLSIEIYWDIPERIPGKRFSVAVQKRDHKIAQKLMVTDKCTSMSSRVKGPPLYAGRGLTSLLQAHLCAILCYVFRFPKDMDRVQLHPTGIMEAIAPLSAAFGRLKS